MSRQPSSHTYRVHDDPRFSHLRQAHANGEVDSEILEGTDDLLQVVSDPGRVIPIGFGMNYPIGANGLFIEYLGNPVGTDLSALNGNRLMMNLSTQHIRGYAFHDTPVQITIPYISLSNGEMVHRTNLSVPLNHAAVAEGMARFQLPLGDPAIATPDWRTGTINSTTGSAMTTGAEHWLFWVNDAVPELHGNGAFAIRMRNGYQDRAWAWNRMDNLAWSNSLFQGGSRGTYYPSRHIYSPRGGLTHWGELGPVGTDSFRFGLGWTQANMAGPFSIPQDANQPLIIDVATGSASMMRHRDWNTGNATTVAWRNNHLALQSIPLGHGLTIEELADFLPPLTADTLLDSHAINLQSGLTYGVYIHMPLGNLQEEDPAAYYTPQTFSFSTSVSPYTRSLQTMRSHFASGFTWMNLEGPDLSVQFEGEGPTYSEGDLPQDLADEEVMAERTTPWTLNFDAQFSHSGQIFQAARLDMESADVFMGFTPYITEAPPGEFPHNWVNHDYAYRAFTTARAIPRHPLMPANHEGITAYTMQGTFVNISKCGDYLLFGVNEDGSMASFTGPVQVYFNSLGTEGPHGPGGTARPAEVSVNILQNFMQGELKPASWQAVERWNEHRNIVRPEFTVHAGSDFRTVEDVQGINLSSNLVEFNQGSITLYGPGNFWSAIPQQGDFPTYIKIRSQNVPVAAGIVTSIQNTPYANGKGITINTATLSEFHNVDLGVINRMDMHLAPDEGEFFALMMRRSGFPGDVYLGRGIYGEPIAFRDTSFWGSTPAEGGPGFLEEEFLPIYQNNTSGSSMDEIRNILYANMLDIYDLPSGDVLIEPILPIPDVPIQDVFAYHSIHYGVDSGGNWTNDARIDVREVRLALDETFSEVEIEGASNEVAVDIRPMKAPFVWGNPLQEREYMDRSTGSGWVSGSNSSDPERHWFNYPELDDNMPFGDRYTALTDPTADPPGDPNHGPWLFARQEPGSGAAQMEIMAERWFEEFDSLNLASSAIKVTKLEGGNRNVTSRGFLVRPPSAFEGEYSPGVSWTDHIVNTLQGARPSESEPFTVNDNIVFGIWARATGPWYSRATFRFEVDVPRIDDATLQVVPMLGKMDDLFFPRWFPVLGEKIAELRDKKPRKAQRVQTPYIAAIGHQFATQMYALDGDLSIYDAASHKNTAANQLATWLSAREFLRTRKVTIAFAGSTHWSPNQFIAIARRPAEGPGHPPTVYDLLLINSASTPDAKVGEEAWVTVECAFVATVDTASQRVNFDMPVGWGSVWEPVVRRSYDNEGNEIDDGWRDMDPPSPEEPEEPWIPVLPL